MDGGEGDEACSQEVVPPLQLLAVVAAAASDYCLAQKRYLQFLPPHAANLLLRLLLASGRLASPQQLAGLRHAVTQCSLSGGSGGASGPRQLTTAWTAYIADCRHLEELSLRSFPRLKDKVLAPLARLRPSLRVLDMSGCSAVTTAGVAALLPALTGLERLVLTGTAVRSPVLQHVCQLGRLTGLELGGCSVSDTDVAQHLSRLAGLEVLELWGCFAGDSSIPAAVRHLPRLRRLGLAWSQMQSVLPLAPRLQALDLSHCRLNVAWPAAAEELACLRLRELRLAHTAVTPACCEALEEVVRACGPSLELLDASSLSGADVLPLLLALEAATALRRLSLSGTRLAGDYLPALAACMALQALDLGSNEGVGEGGGLAATLPALGGGLRRLSLAGTGVGDEALPLLSRLPLLSQLVLSGTSVSWERGGAEAASAAAAAGGGSGGGCWRHLEVLDLRDTLVGDIGCSRLAEELGSPAAAGAGGGGSSGGGLRLRELLVGGSCSRLGRRGLAALARVTTLRRLTLVGFKLQNHDLDLLDPLLQLQELHVRLVDPWLLSDAALAALAGPDQLPSLRTCTRDGRQLVPPPATAGAGAAADGAGAAWRAAVVEQLRLEEAGPPAGDEAGRPSADSPTSWWFSAGDEHSSSAPAPIPSLAAACGGGVAPPAGAGPGSPGAASPGSSCRWSEVNQTLRQRYTREQLISLRGAAGALGAAAMQAAIPGSLLAGGSGEGA